jgi:hypothetical protein
MAEMDKKKLMELGLTEEQADKVMGLHKELIDGNFVTKDRFNEVNTELKQTKENLTERDGQLETLKKSSGDVDALKKEIGDLQAANKTKDETHAAEMTKLKVNSALNSALVGAKAKNPETVKPLLAAFLEKAELEGDVIKGLDDEIKKLVDDEGSKFLFDIADKKGAGVKGWKPGEGKDGGEGSKPSQSATLGEALKSHYEKQ